jgi:3-hydroxyacyl-[acyl-carrier-protein] dehydratase
MQLEYFQLIDRIVELDLTARTIRTQAQVPLTSTVFEGHFPGHPLMPGVLLIETMAQTAGWLLIAVTGFQRMPFLAAVKEAKLRTFVTPGQALTPEAELVHEGSGYAIAAARITLDGKPVCSADLTFRVMEFPNPELRDRMKQRAERLAFPMAGVRNGG